MMSRVTAAVDLAKTVFQVVVAEERGKIPSGGASPSRGRIHDCSGTPRAIRKRLS